MGNLLTILMELGRGLVNDAGDLFYFLSSSLNDLDVIWFDLPPPLGDLSLLTIVFFAGVRVIVAFTLYKWLKGVILP